MARPHMPEHHNKKNGKRKGPRKREKKKLNTNIEVEKENSALEGKQIAR